MYIGEGTLIDGKFKVRGPIGRGGMGVVYEASQLGLDRIIALKLLSNVPEDSKDELVRFEREAVILSKLSHTNIVQFYAYGTWNGLPYIAMERLAGHSLQKLLANNEPLPLLDTIHYVRQICDGLEHAHAHGIFHRDIKPTNIIMSAGPNGHVLLKIIDFGLAKLTGVGIQKLTQTNTALGSVQYMSPEQCTGQPVDQRSDIYSLGCLLYHCLTGDPPYCADNAVAVMFQQVNEPVDNTSGWQRLPAALQDVLRRCMAKEPKDRFQSAGELRVLLNQAGQSDSVATLITLPKTMRMSKADRQDPLSGTAKVWRKELLIASALVLVVSVGGAVWYLRYKASSPSEGPGALSSYVSPNEIMTSLIQKDRRSLWQKKSNGRLSPAEVKQLEQAIEHVRRDPVHDDDRLMYAYLILSRAYDEAGETEKLMSMLSTALDDATGSSTDGFKYVSLLCRYHELCAISGCELSLMDKIKSAKRRFPKMGSDQQFALDFLLANDYVKLGRALDARRILLSIRKSSTSPGQIEKAKSLLKQLDDTEKITAQMEVLSQQLDCRNKAKKSTASQAYALAQLYRSHNKDPKELLLKQSSNPANHLLDNLALRYELSQYYLEEGDRDKCEQIWQSMVEPLRFKTGFDRPFEIYPGPLQGAINHDHLVLWYQYQVVYGLARTYLQRGRYQDCINLTESWSKDGIWPAGVSWNKTWLADSLVVPCANAYRHSGRSAIAENLYRRVIADSERAVEERKKDNSRSYWMAEARCGLACSLYLKGHYQEAARESRQAVDEALKVGQISRAISYRIVLAACLNKLNQSDEARVVWLLAQKDMNILKSNELQQMSFLFDDVVPMSEVSAKTLNSSGAP